MKKLFMQSEDPNSSVYLIPFTCECGTIFAVDNEEEFSYNADTGEDVMWVEAQCPSCGLANFHELPLTKQELVLYAYVQLGHQIAR